MYFTIIIYKNFIINIYRIITGAFNISIWMYLIDSSVGNIFIIQRENSSRDKEIITKLVFDEMEEAEKIYNRWLKKMIKEGGG